MDLWIRSQDRKRLVPNPNLFIVTNENGISYIGDITVGHIAEYNTEKRALEVLDEIQGLLAIDLKISGSYENIDLKIKSLILTHILQVYEMPKE